MPPFAAISAEPLTWLVAVDTPGPERIVMARDELRRLQAALDRLAPRVREVVVLARIEGLSRSEIAQRLGITEVTVSSYLTQGICALADILHGEPANICAWYHNLFGHGNRQ